MNQEAALELLFDVIDSDQSGDISKTELSVIIKVIYHIDHTSSGGLRPEEMTENIFRQIDINDDEKITKKEFIIAFTGDGDENTLIVSSSTFDIFCLIYTFYQNRYQTYIFYENSYQIYIFLLK